MLQHGDCNHWHSRQTSRSAPDPRPRTETFQQHNSRPVTLLSAKEMPLAIEIQREDEVSPVSPQHPGTVFVSKIANPMPVRFQHHSRGGRKRKKS